MIQLVKGSLTGLFIMTPEIFHAHEFCFTHSLEGGFHRPLFRLEIIIPERSRKQNFRPQFGTASNPFEVPVVVQE